MMSGKRADLSRDALGVSERARDPGARHVQPDADHGFLEKLAILALGDRLGIGADQLHVVPNERAVAVQLHRRVERGLPAHRREDRIRLFTFEYHLDYFRRNRLDVGAIGELRIRHDRGRVRVHEHDLVAFFAQRLARLHAGIIEFAALPDDDRAGANEENFLDLIVPRHAQRETMRKPAKVTSETLVPTADGGDASPSHRPASCAGGQAAIRALRCRSR